MHHLAAASIALCALLLSSSASASPPGKSNPAGQSEKRAGDDDKAAKEKAAKDKAAGEKAAGEKAADNTVATKPAEGAKGGAGLFVRPPTSASPQPRALDLRPENAVPRAAGQTGKNERRSGFSLGDDGDWRVQAAQIGVMAAGFAALVGLCQGGRCMLPSPDFLPDQLKAKPQVVPNPRPAKPLRSTR